MSEEKINEQAQNNGAQGEVFVPVEINSETQMLSLEQAATLARKGMEFDTVSRDWERLGALAASKEMEVSRFIDALENEAVQRRMDELCELCGGNKEMAEHVLSLEKAVKPEATDFDELREFFPEIKSREQLPQTVVRSAELKGTKLLDEYLRYQLCERRRLKRNEAKSREANAAWVGSQRQNGPKADAANAEFLRGIWSK